MTDAAQILAAHAYFGVGETCTCVMGLDAPRMSRDQHAAHVLAVLSETHAVVELPEGWRSGDMVQWGSEADNHVWAAKGSQRVRVYTDDPRFPVEDAEEFASRILAAARHARVAEGGDRRG